MTYLYAMSVRENFCSGVKYASMAWWIAGFCVLLQNLSHTVSRVYGFHMVGE